MKRIDLSFFSIYEKTAVIILLFLFIFTRFAGLAFVSGHSMEPAYKSGCFVITTRYRSGQPINRGDVVVVRENGSGSLLVKRVVAVPGDRIAEKGGRLYINGKPEDGDFPLFDDAGCLSRPLFLEENEYFIMGDNRPHSTDSRSFGPVGAEDVVGIVIASL